MRGKSVFAFTLGLSVGTVLGAACYWIVRRNQDLQELGSFSDLDTEFENIFNDDDDDDEDFY